MGEGLKRARAAAKATQQKGKPMAGVKVGKACIHRAVEPSYFLDNEWHYSTEDREVRLLAVAGIWAMVRRPGCVPYVCEVKELHAIEAAR